MSEFSDFKENPKTNENMKNAKALVVATLQRLPHYLENQYKHKLYLMIHFHVDVARMIMKYLNLRFSFEIEEVSPVVSWLFIWPTKAKTFSHVLAIGVNPDGFCSVSTTRNGHIQTPNLEDQAEVIFRWGEEETARKTRKKQVECPEYCINVILCECCDSEDRTLEDMCSACFPGGEGKSTSMVECYYCGQFFPANQATVEQTEYSNGCDLCDPYKWLLVCLKCSDNSVRNRTRNLSLNY